MREKLDRVRSELLDLSARNRLLNMPRSSKNASAVDIIDERSAEVFRLLVQGARPFTFIAGKAASDDEAVSEAGEVDEIDNLAQPEDDETDERGVRTRHSDTRLQTRLTGKGLQKRLLELYFDAKTLEEEQGVNILFLTLGALKWVDPQNAANIRYAPLVLVPVALERGNAGEKFKLRVRPDEYASNLSLEAFLDRVHGIKLPAFEASDSFDPAAYFAEVADAVTAKPDWEVLPDHIVLGFFSFAKFLMYRDLDPDTWPENGKITDRALVRGLLSDGFASSDEMIPEDANIDGFIPPAEMLHILDSDSSQALTIHEVRRGRDMVIQGPPGTGKSQTIANIIASAIADGKTVLFVAEKMAALEVVKRRLDATGVGDACLELHSNKANKRSVLEELRRTWELGPPKGHGPGTLHARLLVARDGLNAHSGRMHGKHQPSDLTPYQAIGQLSRLRFEGQKPGDLILSHPASWSPDDFAARHDVIAELVERIGIIGNPDSHSWRGVGLVSISPTDAERLSTRILDIATRLANYDDEQSALAIVLETHLPNCLQALDLLTALAKRLADAPALAGSALADPAWERERPAIAELLNTGAQHAALRQALDGVIQPEAWNAELSELASALDLLPPEFSLDAFGRMSQAAHLLPRFIAEAGRLAISLGRDTPTSIFEARRIAEIGKRVAAAPDASPEVFAADLWDAGVERAGDLATAVAKLEQARATIGNSLTDAAWGIELAEARTVLAAHGSGFFKIFSGDWRRSNRLVRSVLSHPDTPLPETLAVLDALTRGQTAKRTIDREADFGSRAFGADWRGDRSVSAPLTALVEWMRSLKGLGAEPRLIASRRPEKSNVDARAASTAALVDESSDLLSRLWSDLGASRALAFGDADHATHADLLALHAVTVRVSAADRASAALFVDLPEAVDTRRTRIATIAEAQAAAAKLGECAPLGRAAFGQAWKGPGSDWVFLQSASHWISANPDIRGLAGRTQQRAKPAASAATLAATRTSLLAELEALFDQLRLDVLRALDVPSAASALITGLRQRLDLWASSSEQLFQWVAYRDRAEKAKALGCADVVARLGDGRLQPQDAVSAFEMAYYEAIYAAHVRAEPELGVFNGLLHGRLARDFAEMDRQRITSASFEVVSAHHKRVPARDGGAVGPLGVLRTEINKKRGHMPIRKLMATAAPAIQALKPVFMMSPLSVAQFLTPGLFDFDLLVMDEASQIQPVDALGAVARAKQVVVVGDPKQLPPTAFFSKMTSGSDDDDEDGTGRVADIESILGLFTARGLPMRMLRWHYRSKHQSLIAVSNRQFYENKLFIVPSPYTVEAGMGLRFHHITHGTFDAGATRTNMVEAKAVAEAIVAHAHDHADLTLGVAAFSVAQRRAILDQLEILRRTLPPEVEAFFQAHHSEPFFVKNLENVQGDERDVIFISVGYGPTVVGGRVPMRFGPLGSEGGERRLNVLISRAKQRCEVFSSMTDEDIDPDFAATRKGVFAFKLFMHFARTGKMTMAESTGRDHDSVFEEQVAKALQARGYQVHRQVGLAGFFIDLAVADPERPGAYLLGIECDGAAYHSSRSARDRDRLRQSVLESHGWSIHRIWSTDWFQRPNEQLELVISRVEAAKAEFDARAQGRKPQRAVPFEIVSVEREDVTEMGIVVAELTAPNIYLEATVTRPSHIVSELHATPTGTLSMLAEGVVDVEGPVHIDEVVNRIRDAWGLKRAGARIQEAVEKAIEISVHAGRLSQTGDFLVIPGRSPQVRDRSNVESPTLRRVDTLPPAELEIAVLEVVRTNFGATDDQICQAVARAVGFKSTSSQLRDLIAAAVTDNIAKGWVERQNGIVVVGPSAPAIAEPPKPANAEDVLV